MNQEPEMDQEPESVSPQEALDKVFELAGRLADAMRETLTERGLTPGRAEAVLVLHRLGPAVQRALSEALACTPRHVTALVDVLEEQGWAARGPHPTDRRATVVTLTEQGTAVAVQLATERDAAARALLGDVPPADLATFVRIADQLMARMGRPPEGG